MPSELCAATVSADRAVDDAELLDDVDVVDVRQPGAAVLLGKDHAEHPELAELFERFEREVLRLVPLHDVRLDLALGEVAHHLLICCCSSVRRKSIRGLLGLMDAYGWKWTGSLEHSCSGTHARAAGVSGKSGRGSGLCRAAAPQAPDRHSNKSASKKTGEDSRQRPPSGVSYE